MSSLRVVSVVLLAGLGAAAAGLAGTSPGDPAGSTPERRAATASVTVPDGRPSTVGNARATRSGAASFDVRAENARKGTRDWRISTARGTAPGLAAYADAVSVRAGDRVPLHVRGAGTVQVRALRIGWYGGTGAREVWSSTVQAGTGDQDDPASWPSQGWADTEGWPPGQYLLRLDLGAASRYVPLTVRSPQLSGALVLVSSPLTWQAENGPTPAGARARSFDRPYGTGYGAGSFLATDAPLVQLAERDGRRLAYTTDLDIARDRDSIGQAAGLAFGSASQYWTADMRTAVIAAIGSGTNVAFLGAGTGTLRVELSSDGRSMTVDRAVPPASPALTGLVAACGEPAVSGGPAALAGDAAWVVQDPAWWGYAEAGVSAGQALPGLVSATPDTTAAAPAGTPVAAARLASSPVTCDGTAGRSQAAAYWTTPAGAGVFTAGTARWVCVAGGTCPSSPGTSSVPVSTRKMTAAVTRTVLQAFAEPAAGRAHPAS